RTCHKGSQGTESSVEAAPQFARPLRHRVGNTCATLRKTHIARARAGGGRNAGRCIAEAYLRVALSNACLGGAFLFRRRLSARACACVVGQPKPSHAACRTGPSAGP